MTSTRRDLPMGVCAWTVSVPFGAVLMDDVYAGKTGGNSDDGRDLLLAIGAPGIVVGTPAVTVAWTRPTARILLVASLTLGVGDPLVPVLLSGVVLVAEEATGVRVGPWLRLGGTGAASVLAFAGWWAALRGLSGEA